MDGVDLSRHLRSRLAELVPGVDRLLLGVSGGADSVALLLALHATGARVVAAHLDHSLRPDSQEDARFVAELTSRLRVELVSRRVDVGAVADRKGWNVEDAGRRLRYEFLSRSARTVGAGAIVTAHTQDDQAETVLMQLLRGAAYPKGMPAVRGTVVRPLLDVTHEELVTYLTDRGEEWREDPSNSDRRLLRAWLRHELLPSIRGRFPSAGDRLADLARLQRDVAEYLKREAARRERAGGFDLATLERVHPAVQREAIRSLFDQAGAAPSMASIEGLRAQLGRKEPFRVSVGPGVWIRLAYGRLELARVASRAPARTPTTGDQLPPGVPESVLALPGLELRSRQPGDRMRLPGGSKSLARILVDRKVPREERDALEVLATGSRVLWAEGIGVAADLPEGSAPPGGGSAESSGAIAVREEDRDLRFMRRALDQAALGARTGELPVGAVVVRNGEVVGEAHNETETRDDPSAHAEILAMRRAAASIGDWRLAHCTLYVTLEPCPMCAGALLQAHLPRVVFGASNPRDGAIGSVIDLLAAPWKRTLEVRSGVLARQAGRMLSDFFRDRREGGIRGERTDD